MGGRRQITRELLFALRRAVGFLKGGTLLCPRGVTLPSPVRRGAGWPWRVPVPAVALGAPRPWGSTPVGWRGLLWSRRWVGASRGIRKRQPFTQQVASRFHITRGPRVGEKSPTTWESRTSTWGHMWMENSPSSRATAIRAKDVEATGPRQRPRRGCHSGGLAAPWAPGAPAGSSLC